MRATCGAVGLSLLVATMFAAPVAAQLPEEFTNLQVLPQDMSRRALVGVMRNFSLATGLRCSGCHLGEEGQPLSEYDFASDERDAKKKAREMMRMVGAINGEHLAALPARSEPNVRVTCATCHGGVRRPMPIQDLIIADVASDGIEAAIYRYEELRLGYYGSRAYDFSERSLIFTAQALAGDDDQAAALALLELNLGYHPNSTQTYAAIGDLHRASGDVDQAIQAFERILEIDPEHGLAHRRLTELRGG